MCFRSVSVFFPVVLTLAASVVAQSERPRPTDLPSDKNLIAFANRAHAVQVAALQKATPIIEVYFQRFVPSVARVSVPMEDLYYLGRLKWTQGPTKELLPTMELLLNSEETSNHSEGSSASNGQQLLDGLASLMMPDWNQLSLDRYSFEFVGRTFLGAVRCAVFEVTPLTDPSGFSGRVYFEDRLWNIVRFTGTNEKADAMLSALRGNQSRFKVDGWRVNGPNNAWVPAYTYIEEVTPIGSPEAPSWRAHMRFWGYDRNSMHLSSEYTGLRLEQSASTSESTLRDTPTPQRAQRLFEDEATRIVLARLVDAGVLGASGQVEQDCEQILTNLVVTSSLALPARPQCRILLTLPLESFIVGDTVVIGRSVVDVGTESSIALVVAHQLAHYALGHRTIDTKFGFADILQITDRQLLQRLRFRHSPGEEAAADAKAMDILEKSPYAKTMSEVGLFLQVLRARAYELRGLISPTFGEHIVDVEHVVENSDMFRLTQIYDADDAAQAPATLPLLSKLTVDPYSGRLGLLKTDAVPNPLPRERAELAVLAVRPFLEYASPNTENAAIPRAVDSQPASPSQTSRSVGSSEPAKLARPPATVLRKPTP